MGFLPMGFLPVCVFYLYGFLPVILMGDNVTTAVGSRYSGCYPGTH